MDDKTYDERHKIAHAKMREFERCEHKNMQQFTEYCMDCGQNIWATSKEVYDLYMGHR